MIFGKGGFVRLYWHFLGHYRTYGDSLYEVVLARIMTTGKKLI